MACWFAALDPGRDVYKRQDRANPAVTSAIIGANTIAQLEDTTRGAAVKLSAEEKTALDKVTAWEKD